MPRLPIDMDDGTTGPENGDRPDEKPAKQVTAGSLCREDDSSLGLTTSIVDVFQFSPETALRLLCINVEHLRRPVSPEELTTKLSPGNKSNGALPAELELHCVSPNCRQTDADMQDAYQQSVLCRRFLSKREPSIALKDYIARLHRFCPMSTAVFLAASMYVTRMVTIRKVIMVIPENMHRFILAGLRVAMKALEDRNFAHSRFAKVGGVTERELLRLELSFCYLADFELRVDAEMLLNEARSVQQIMATMDGLE